MNFDETVETNEADQNTAVETNQIVISSKITNEIDNSIIELNTEALQNSTTYVEINPDVDMPQDLSIKTRRCLVDRDFTNLEKVDTSVEPQLNAVGLQTIIDSATGSTTAIHDSKVDECKKNISSFLHFPRVDLIPKKKKKF